ncbi:hypothetical protein Raf01_96450 [Rugosimonospora africana]|uniref:Uncharacterized protein n=1 Tax=Rugosimonospora africana TaxID=556532 RepID=A0A8J3R4D0_9ACTN|nr:hypothetical protein Raf01_96450 [Rugosimonospora africana]
MVMQATWTCSRAGGPVTFPPRPVGDPGMPPAARAARTMPAGNGDDALYATAAPLLGGPPPYDPDLASSGQDYSP